IRTTNNAIIAGRARVSLDVFLCLIAFAIFISFKAVFPFFPGVVSKPQDLIVHSLRFGPVTTARDKSKPLPEPSSRREKRPRKSEQDLARASMFSHHAPLSPSPATHTDLQIAVGIPRCNPRRPERR